ncbi:hypothetical protein ASPBRDRAFT_662191 [Aspergillus brasiliensis CBS 101740]|uniref:Uncharacterized protein n=1 Tax=Aspergillus brasiliensis (strain CBS 101740 / IMI 381727 / IBT 21946) TaxID=767769 RepID=A0A1L9U5A2_ASPBC|nr:hypothetical protein ASPBRDRAFT_662191 [Aspergillus brasiliensis CBS 101740]
MHHVPENPETGRKLPPRNKAYSARMWTESINITRRLEKPSKWRHSPTMENPLERCNSGILAYIDRISRGEQNGPDLTPVPAQFDDKEGNFYELYPLWCMIQSTLPCSLKELPVKTESSNPTDVFSRRNRETRFLAYQCRELSVSRYQTSGQKGSEGMRQLIDMKKGFKKRGL